jgi:hypothetical protein
MLEWLNRNGAAVQAAASICSVVATIALLLVTRQYVLLTQELALAAREQLRLQQRTAASEAAQLLTLTDVFLGSLKKFPSAQGEHEKLRTLSLWKHADVTQFGSLAASVLGQRSEVQRAMQRLNWLRNTAERVQQQADDDLRRFPWSDWTRQVEEAHQALRAVRRSAESAVVGPAEQGLSEASAPPDRSVRTTADMSRPDNSAASEK